MVENTTYITKAEPAEQQEKRAEEILRDMLSSSLFFMCAVLVTLNAVISVIDQRYETDSAMYTAVP